MTIQLMIQLRGIQNPTVWRRIIIPGNYTFEDLHYAIQSEFGWYNEHLYQFQKDAYSRGWLITDLERNDNGLGERSSDASIVRVGKFLKEKKLKKFVYVYDFGDDWIHDITVEKIDELADISGAINQGGRGTCPPEDCGGPFRYEYMKRILKEEPDSEEAQEWREWLGLEDGETFDPDSYVENYIDDLDLDDYDDYDDEKDVDEEYEDEWTQKIVNVDDIEDITLLECMREIDFATLAEYAEDMHFEIDPNGNEEEQRKRLADEIISHPWELICMLPLQDLHILDTLRQKPQKAHVTMYYKDFYDHLLIIYGLARDFYDEDGLYYIQIPADLWKAVKRYADIDKIFEDKNKEIITSIECVIEGICNLYGRVSKTMMKQELLSHKICETLDNANKTLKELENTSLLMKWLTNNYNTSKPESDDLVYYVSRYGWDDLNEFEKELNSHNDVVKDYHRFTNIKDIVSATMIPIPKMSNAYFEDFSAYLENRLNMNDAEILQTCLNIWYYAQHEGEEKCRPAADYFMEKLMTKPKKELKTEEFVVAMKHLDNYLNNMPHWQLRGHTPKEVNGKHSDYGKKFGQIQNVFDKHFNKNQDEYEELPEMYDPYDWAMPTKPYIAPKIPGRNDPCPCGSGKKYKNCCGRGN